MNKPIAIATWKRSGESAVRAASEVLKNKGNALDAVEKAINVVELNPNDRSVGYGGRPNSEGVVELDAAIMDGLTHDAGSVAGMQGIKCPISVARKVMERTRHVMLVGENAKQFAIKQGFKEENLLTKDSEKDWKEWKLQNDKKNSSHDTIGVVALDVNGNLAVGCSTSGISYKLPGRVGDSPLIGSGLYVDNDVGGASATGLGEELLKFCSSFLVVEFMRNGLSPQDACQKTIERILAKKPENCNVLLGLVAIDREGNYGAGSSKGNFSYAIWYPDKVEIFEIG